MFNRMPIMTRKLEMISVGSRGTRPVWKYSIKIGMPRIMAII